jgi:hypothetical protein
MSDQFDKTSRSIKTEFYNKVQACATSATTPVSIVAASQSIDRAAKVLTNNTLAYVNYDKAALLVHAGATSLTAFIIELSVIAKSDNAVDASTFTASPLSDALPIYPPDGTRFVVGARLVNGAIEQVDDFVLSVAPGATVEYQLGWQN